MSPFVESEHSVVGVHVYFLQNDVRRDEFFTKISNLMSQLMKYVPVDAAADQVLLKLVII